MPSPEELQDKYRQKAAQLGDIYETLDQKMFDVADYYTKQRFQETPQYAVAELGDTYETLGEQYGFFGRGIPWSGDQHQGKNAPYPIPE